MRVRASFAAFGAGLALCLSVVQAVPAFYNGFERTGLARELPMLLPIAAQAAILVFLVLLCLGRETAGLPKTAAVAAVLVAVQLAAQVLQPMPRISEGQSLLWLFGPVLGDFGWVVFLVLWARGRDTLAQRETRAVAFLLAATTVLTAIVTLDPLLGDPRWAVAGLSWLLPFGQFWSWFALASVVAIHLCQCVTLVVFFVGNAGEFNA